MILEACTRIRRPAVLATVVRVAGSAYRRPGARMLIDADGRTEGMVSGGCLETDLADRAGDVLRAGASETVVYDMRSPDDIVWGLGLGCDGEVRVLLEALDPSAVPAWCAFAVETRERRGYAAIATVFEAPRAERLGRRCWANDRGAHGPIDVGTDLDRAMMRSVETALADRRSRNENWELADGTYSGLVEVVGPRIRLCVFGAGADALPLVEQAAALDWHVDVFDHREPFADAGRFPRAGVVRCVDYAGLDAASLKVDGRTAGLLMTHHFLHDRSLLERLIELPWAYLGVLGPRRRLERLMEALTEDGLRPSTAARERLHGPVGLDIGSETPQEIALSAVAEIQAVINERDGGRLRKVTRPLHDWPR
ncbi:MAG: XdhC/CoxI family protein [Acidobacteria bacterium]|nr:XdhC/CoxI family protein [Acidobacteriota bacterium]NIM60222.1 XdhC/CoxI family protein [Acidobacteriota bacterium]NIO60260.1 XdhC/CoxI family protein [Acidobacteriota bacterium]NIQ31315.1 XdhC/CoxI family protein [Acidobacteriota bacterium]NIQ86538.1 XdhC/CoxI family protein [Acidobacteriota bacterium]